jgi:LAO/AO transport system kinase
MAPAIPTLDDLRRGGKRMLARALALIETAEGSAELARLLDEAAEAGKGEVLGLTGPPGVGKSTLINALIGRWRKAGETVGVIAVDPSSRASGGALLGDRARMKTDPEDAGIFVRSLAARDRLGGLSDHAIAATVLMRAVFDHVIVETVGVGQSEGDVADVADLVLLLVQPGSGDSLQFMKAGIMELPDLIAVTKADLGIIAERTRADLEGALSLTGAVAEMPIPVIHLSATSDDGMDRLIQALADVRIGRAAAGLAAERRRVQPHLWLEEAIRTGYGRRGLAAIDAAAVLEEAGGPFKAIAALSTIFSRWGTPH